MAVRPVFVLGATASGKHEAGLLVAERLGAEIVSVDSMKVYRGMDIGAAKPPAAVLARTPHHLIDICDPGDSYNAGRFVQDARRVQAEIEGRGKRPLFLGGTSLYYKSFVYGIFDGPSADAGLRQELVAMGGAALHEELSRVDPGAARRIHPNDLKRLVRAVEVFRKTGRPISERQTHFDRPRLDAAVVCIWRERDDLMGRIGKRVGRMLQEGLVEEVRRLTAGKWGPEGRGAVGYREVVDHLEGRCALADVEPRIVRDTWQLARKQLTWFRSFGEARPVAAAASDGPEQVARKILAVIQE